MSAELVVKTEQSVTVFNWQLHLDKSAGQYSKKLLMYRDIHMLPEYTCSTAWINKIMIEGPDIYVLVTNELGAKTVSICDLYKYSLNGECVMTTALDFNVCDIMKLNRGELLCYGIEGQMVLIDTYSGSQLWRKQDSGGYYRLLPHRKHLKIDSGAFDPCTQSFTIVNAVGCITTYSKAHFFTMRQTPTEQYFHHEFAEEEYRFRNEVWSKDSGAKLCDAQGVMYGEFMQGRSASDFDFLLQKHQIRTAQQEKRFSDRYNEVYEDFEQMRFGVVDDESETASTPASSSSQNDSGSDF
jgi:hypothetical protein